MTDRVLELCRVTAGYGGAVALESVDLRAAMGECVFLLGANGSGKSTLIGCMGGMIPLFDGRITFDGKDITELESEKRVSLGIGVVADHRHLFNKMTVKENLYMGGYLLKKKEMNKQLSRVLSILPEINPLLSKIAGNLSGGEMQLVSIGRALMSSPRMLILDEPSVGLSPFYTGCVYRALEKVKAQGVGLIIAEESVVIAKKMGDYCYVMSNGKIAFHGEVSVLNDKEKLKKAYLGVVTP